MSLTTILMHAPTWVWILLAALVTLGLKQSLPRQVSLGRAAVLPVAMVVLSISGTVSAFHGQAAALGSWAAGVAAALLLTRVLGLWRGIGWSAEHRCLEVPGSWLPLALILALFSLKFAVGASLAMHPTLAHDTSLAAAAGLAYGFFSGAFLGRSVVMWQAAHRGLQAPLAY